MSDRVVHHPDGQTSLHADIVEANTSSSQVTGPSVAAAAAINFQHPRPATVADVVCALHKADPNLAERAMQIHEANAEHMRSMDVKNQALSSRDQLRIMIVEIVGAFVLPALAVGLVVSMVMLAKADAPWVAFPATGLAFCLIAWVVKAKADNIHLTANVGKK